LAEIFESPPTQEGHYKPLGGAKLLDHDERSIRMGVGSTTVEVTALTPDLFRVGMFPEGRPPDYTSEAVAKGRWEPVAAEMTGEGEISFSTEAATVHISLNPLRISFSDPSGRILAADDAELGMGVVELPGTDVFSTPWEARSGCTRGAKGASGTSDAGSVPAASIKRARTRSSGT
jgi:hypothetical protein